MSHLNFVYLFELDCFGLEMNEKFVKYVQTFKDMFANLGINSYNKNKYDRVEQINTDWIKSKFNVDDAFIKWWTYCIQHKLLDLLNHVGVWRERTLMWGFKIDKKGVGDVKYDVILPVKFDDDLHDFYWKFLLFSVCRTCNFYYDGHGPYISSCHNLKDIYLANLYQLQEYNKYKGKPYEISILQQETKNLKECIDKHEFLLSGNINCKKIEFPVKPIATTDMIDELKQIIADQKQTIDELNKKIDQQHQDFEAYKLQKRRQLAVIMV